MVYLRFFAAFIATAFLSGCVLQFDAVEDYEETFDPGTAMRLDLVGLDGDVNLRGQASDSIKIRGTRAAVGATRAAARENLEKARLEEKPPAGEGLRLEFDPPVEYIGLIDLELDRVSTIPIEFGVGVEVERGDLQVDGVLGDLDLATERGDIEVLGGEGDVSAIADSGTVRVQSSGEIEIESGGRVRVEALGVSENRVGVVTGGATINLAIAPQDFEIICYTQGGRVEVAEGLEADSVELEDGAVGVTSGTGARKIELRSGGADVEIEVLTN